jgi:hypothetical protein
MTPDRRVRSVPVRSVGRSARSGPRPLPAWLLGLLLCVAGAGAAADAPGFRFRKDLDRGAHGGEAILSVTLDRDIYAATRPGFPDLRIRDDSGREVPYVLEQVGERKRTIRHEPCASEVVSLKEQDGGALEVLVRLDEKAPSASGLTVHTPLTDYEHRVRVSGSNDGRDWSPLVADGLIFDYRRFMDLRNRDVPLPENEFRQFRVVIEQVQDERESPLRVLTRSRRGEGPERTSETTTLARRLLRIDRIALWRNVETEGEMTPRKAAYPIEGFTVEQDPKRKRTRIRVRTAQEPLTRLVPEVGRGSFSRRAAVRVPATRGIETTWSEVGQGTIYRVQLGDFRREDLRLDFPEQRGRAYAIAIDNEDSPPLEITGVQAEGNVYRLLFVAAPGRRYHAEYGSDAADPPRYDTAAVLSHVRPGFATAEARLGGAIANPGYRPGRGLRGWLDRPIVLIAAIALMVVVLAWALLRAGTLAAQMPKEDAGPGRLD